MNFEYLFGTSPAVDENVEEMVRFFLPTNEWSPSAIMATAVSEKRTPVDNSYFQIRTDINEEKGEDDSTHNWSPDQAKLPLRTIENENHPPFATQKTRVVVPFVIILNHSFDDDEVSALYDDPDIDDQDVLPPATIAVLRNFFDGVESLCDDETASITDDEDSQEELKELPIATNHSLDTAEGAFVPIE